MYEEDTDLDQDTGAEVDNSTFFDLHPSPARSREDKLEYLAERLFSEEHLQFMLRNHASFYQLSVFVNNNKPQYATTLLRYLEMTKALKAIEYANAVASKIRWSSHKDCCKFTRTAAATAETQFQAYARKELKALCTEVLPAFITYTLVSLVVDCVTRDITGQAPTTEIELVGSLAEVFCLTDPSVPDNPIVFASEEFYRTTQYGISYAIDRNCRFLQGPGTDRQCISRLSQALAMQEEICETILNYRRDGSPFMNLLMCAPLYDDKGTVRYFIGAQVDVSGLIVDGMGIETFRAFLQSSSRPQSPITTKSPHTEAQLSSIFLGGEPSDHPLRRKTSAISNCTFDSGDPLEKLKNLGMLFNQDEFDVVHWNCKAHGRAGGFELGNKSISQTSVDGIPFSPERKVEVSSQHQGGRFVDPDVGNEGIDLSLLKLTKSEPSFGLPGVYKHYILTQPFPSLRILFVSASLRLPGLVRTPIFDKLGGPASVLSSLREAFQNGAPITTRVTWLSKSSKVSRPDSDRGRQRWIRCTPLLGSNNRVGVWIIILVPLDGNYRNDLEDNDMSQRAASDGYSRAGSTSSSHETEDWSWDNTSARDSLPALGLGLRNTGRPIVASRMEKEKEKDMNDNMYADYLRSIEMEPTTSIRLSIAPPNHRKGSQGTD